MNKLGLRFVFGVLAIAFAAQLPAQEEAAISREDSVTLDIVANVSAIDYETREIELTDAQGHVRRLTADERVQRLNEVEVGDQVTAQIEVSILAEVRQPTEDELAHADEIRRGVVRVPEGEPIAGSVSESVTSVVTVVGLNLLNGIITVRTADGNLVDVLAESESNLKQLRLGDTIVITASASVVASVSKL